jgi:cytosine/adenosine deaminase-related metal-dependent hydrolase
MDGTFPISSVKNTGLVGYLCDLQLLDEKTICVHCVHLDEEGIQQFAETGAHICLCPGSNRFLHVGIAPVEKILAAGISPAIGTDSIASNPELDLWREMSLIVEEHPQIKAEAVLRMATINGAEALGRQADFGSLAPGFSAQFLGVRSAAFNKAKSSEKILELLVSSGRPEEIVWLGNHGRKGIQQ